MKSDKYGRKEKTNDRIPTWQFRDQVIPARVLHLAQQGEISLSDLLLLCIINSLVKPQTNEDGEGCFATNDYLGKATNCHPLHVARSIGKLVKKRLLVTLTIGGTRYLEAEWSRTAEERDSLGGLYGAKLRKAYADQILGERVNKNVNPRVNKNVNHNTNLINTNGEKDEVRDTPDTTGTSNDTKINRLEFKFPVADPPPSPSQKLTQKLLDVLNSHQRFKGKRRPTTKELRSWDKEFAEMLREINFDEVWKILEWYDKNMGISRCPQPMKASTFRDKIDSFRAAMRIQKERAAAKSDKSLVNGRMDDDDNYYDDDDPRYRSRYEPPTKRHG